MKKILDRIRERKTIIDLQKNRDAGVQIFEEQVKKLNGIRGTEGMLLIENYFVSQAGICYELLKNLKETDSEERIRTQEKLKVCEEFLKYIEVRKT